MVLELNAIDTLQDTEKYEEVHGGVVVSFKGNQVWRLFEHVTVISGPLPPTLFQFDCKQS